MRSFNHLLRAIAEPDNLWSAWLEARRGKRRQQEAAGFELDAERHLGVLRRQLLAGTYEPGPYRLIVISDPKQRLIAAAPFRDRVVHHAVVRVLHPCYGRRFIHDSYACLPGRGSHRAVLRFLRRVRSRTYVMTLDMVRYFPSVSWDIVLDLLAARTTDQGFLDLMATMLKSGSRVYGDPGLSGPAAALAAARPRHGLPIGNYTSQWLGNLFLDGLDHLAKRGLRIRDYQRYMDDIAFFADSKAQLHDWRDAIVEWLHDHRGLDAHVERAHPRPCQGRHKYLGYVITPSGVRPGRRIERRMRERLPQLIKGNPERLRRSIAAYRGAYQL